MVHHRNPFHQTSQQNYPEALEGWLSHAGYLSHKDDPRNSRSSTSVPHVSRVLQASEHVRLDAPDLSSHLPRDVRNVQDVARDIPGLHLHKLGTMEQRSNSLSTRTSRPTSRRTSLLHESSYQDLVSQRAAAKAKLDEDLRAVASERWSEPFSPERHQRSMQLTQSHSQKQCKRIEHCRIRIFGIFLGIPPCYSLS